MSADIGAPREAGSSSNRPDGDGTAVARPGPGKHAKKPKTRVKVPVPRRKKRDPEGRMSLADHLRELRNRAIISAIAVVACGVIGWIQYRPLLELLTAPLRTVSLRQNYGEVGLNFQGLTTPFGLQLTVALWLGVILSAPVWLWQVWAFIVPGLTKRERNTAIVFICAAVPLFFAGCALAYYVLPTAVRVLLDFTPEGQWNLIPADQYLAFVTRFILAFGIAFLVPVLLVFLNFAHVLPAHIMIKGWRFAILLNFVFAAMMTPTPDAWTMIALALPMCALYFGACGVAYLLDRRRAKKRPDWSDLADDEASPL